MRAPRHSGRGRHGRVDAEPPPGPGAPSARPILPTVRAALLAAAVLLAACAPDGAPAGPTAPALRATVTAAADDGAGSVERRLVRAAEGLYYTSESDYPFELFVRPAAATAPLTITGFRVAAGVPADSLVEEIALDDFLARHIELADPEDPAAQALVPRYRHLRTTIRTALRDPRVFRVGRVLIRCYVVGVDDAGGLVGLTTWAVET